MAYVIGIDLGTTNSVVACLEGGKPQVMQNAEGGKTTPSVVHFGNDSEVIVGELAKRQRLLSPERTVYSAKRFVGCRWDESEDRRRGLDYRLAPTPEGLVGIQAGGRLLLPEEVQAHVLKKMKQTAEDFLGVAISQAVITCPAYFNDSQRQATKKAAEMAGLEALRVLNEPTAAALAFGMGKSQGGKIAVFDFGGGTFDISILEIDGEVFEVRATCGDTFLGGDVIDRLLSDWIVGRMREEQGLDLRDNPQAMSRVTEAAEKVKCELSTLEKTMIALPFIGADESGPRHFNAELTRQEFERMIEPLLERLKAPCIQALKDARLKPENLTSVILVGGSTRIPAVWRLVKEIFGREPDRSVNPDEAVALGAAIQGGIMSGELEEILLLDVTPLSLGIELAGGLFSALIPRNSSIPTTAKKKFTTVRDNQTSVMVHVLQGERKKASENRTLARLRLEGIAPAPREVPEIEVNFTIDANGILQVSAMDLTTGSLQHIRIESYQPVLDGETEKLLKAADQKVDDDRAFIRKLAVARRLEEIRQDVWGLQKRGDGGILDEEQERRVFEAIFKLDVALTQDDWARIDDAERQLKSVYAELMICMGLVAGTDADSIVFESGTGAHTENSAASTHSTHAEPPPAQPSPEEAVLALDSDEPPQDSPES